MTRIHSCWLLPVHLNFACWIGNSKDTIAIGEPDISPFEGDYATSNNRTKKITWFLQSINKKGFVDFNTTIQWI